MLDGDSDQYSQVGVLEEDVYFAVSKSKSDITDLSTVPNCHWEEGTI